MLNVCIHGKFRCDICSYIEEIKEERDYYKRWHDNYVEAYNKQKEDAERYEKILKEIVKYSKYEGNQWYENAKKALKR